MAEIKIPVVYPKPDIDVIGLHCFIGDAINLVDRSQRPQVQQTIANGLLYIQGPAEELRRLVPVIRKALTDYANRLLTQAGNINITENETKW